MQLIINRNKPTFDLTQPVLCDFRSSKAYLWALVRSRLQSLQSSSNRPLLVLDAACHALITRSMFPNKSRYFGLDISSSRLIAALKICLDGDTLYKANLCDPLSLDACFDIIVSLNTFSHLSTQQQFLALRNLISCCRTNAHLFVNISVNQDMSVITHSLLQVFQTVEPIYFDSFLSHERETAGLLHSSNIISSVQDLEVSLPNDASLHRQVLLHASSYKPILKSCDPPSSPTGSFYQLNNVLSVSISNFVSDKDALLDHHLDCKNNLVFFTAGLSISSYGGRLKEYSTSLDIIVSTLDIDLPLLDLDSDVIVFGLEKNWSSDLAFDRLCINRLRQNIKTNLRLIRVKSRDGSPCVASLLFDDI